VTARKPPIPPPDQPIIKQITIGAGALKWTIGVVGSLLVAIVAWFAVWDRIDTHWRLETVQAATDKRVEANIAAVKDKADADTKTIARRAEIGRAWVLSAVAETKAYTAAQFARICRPLKLAPDECSRQDADATQFRQEAMEAKRAASDAGKDK